MDERDANHPPLDEGAVDDRALWAPVKTAPVPPPDPSFMTSLMARLDDADAEARPAAARPARRWWSGRRLRLAVATAAAAAFVLGVVLIGLPGGEQVGQAPSIAAARTRMNEAMASIKTLQGDLVITDNSASQAGQGSVRFVDLGQNQSALVQSSPGSATNELRLRFVLTAEGDARIEGGDPSQEDYYLTTFDSRSHTVRELVKRSGTVDSYAVYVGDNALPGGPFDPFARLNRMLGSYVRGILAEGAPGWQVVDATYEGRAAWELTGPAPEAQLPSEQLPSPSPERRDLRIVIDKQMGIPLRLASSSNGQVLHEERLENLVLDAPQSASLFTQSPPEHASVAKIDYGYRRGSLSWAARKMDYRPLIPTLLPAGYHLAAVYCQAETPSSTHNAWTSPSDHGMTLVYRRGFDTFVVATHTLGNDVPSWGGASGILRQGYYGSPQTVALTAGELAGTSAEVSVTYQKPPMLIVNTGNREYLVDGDLTRKELLGVANSLTKWSP